ncbi:MAG: hypothetical protein P8K80_07980 [Phycisphaerales bacterium]|nr:hypothetical protein [Phycisphaerales bacterium]
MIRLLSLAGIIVLSSFMAAAAPSTAVRWQLDALDPSDPSQYFLRAEEVADVATDARQRRLAIRLYALAVTLDPEQWGTSGLLGIIELVEDESTIRALRSMIELQEGRSAGLLPDSRVVLGQTDRATIAAFDVLSYARSGEVLDARRRLRSIPGVRERLLVYQDEIPGGMQRLIDDLSVSKESGSRQRLTQAEQVAQLQVQLRLLGGREESWSATLMAWRGRPMQSLESHDLGSLLGLDLDRRVWRSDRWQPVEEVLPADTDQ